MTSETLTGEITTNCDTNSLLPASVTSVTTSAKDISLALVVTLVTLVILT